MVYEILNSMATSSITVSKSSSLIICEVYFFTVVRRVFACPLIFVLFCFVLKDANFSCFASFPFHLPVAKGCLSLPFCLFSPLEATLKIPTSDHVYI